MPPYSLLPQKQRGLEWDRGRFLKTGYLSDKVYSVTPHRTAPAQEEPRSSASFVAERSILTIIADLGCPADAEGPSHTMFYVTTGCWLHCLLLHHQENPPH